MTITPEQNVFSMPSTHVQVDRQLKGRNSMRRNITLFLIIFVFTYALGSILGIVFAASAQMLPGPGSLFGSVNGLFFLLYHVCMVGGCVFLLVNRKNQKLLRYGVIGISMLLILSYLSQRVYSIALLVGNLGISHPDVLSVLSKTFLEPGSLTSGLLLILLLLISLFGLDSPKKGSEIKASPFRVPEGGCSIRRKSWFIPPRRTCRRPHPCGSACPAAGTLWASSGHSVCL